MVAFRVGLSSDPGASAASPPPSPSTAHGSNFQLQSHLDNSFCIEVAGGATEGRAVTLQQCNAGAAQRWAFTWNNDDTNLIVETQGMCLDGHYSKAALGLPMTVVKCGSSKALHFAVTPLGQIMDVTKNKCLYVPRAASGVAVFLVACDVTDSHQVWHFAQ